MLLTFVTAYSLSLWKFPSHVIIKIFQSCQSVFDFHPILFFIFRPGWFLDY